MSVVSSDVVHVERVPFAKAEISPEGIHAVSRVLSSGWLTTGPEVAAFEKDLAEWLGAPHAVAVSSCTAAIEIALRSLRLEPGARVLTSTMTFCGAANAILHAGLRPVLVDIDPDTLMPDAGTTAEAVRRVGGAEAMVALHFAGHPAPVEEMAEAAGLPLDRVVEDAAHALGTSVGDRAVGTISRATCFSFYATKNLPIGEGGMIATPDPEVAEFARRARLHGMSKDAWKRYMPGNGWRYSVELAGLKANMTDVQAAIGRAGLQHFPGWQQRRAELAARYDELLGGIDGIRPPARPDRGRHAWHIYVIRVEPRFGVARDQLIETLAQRGIDCSVHFIPLHQLPYMRRIIGEPEAAGGFPVADRVFPEVLSLPLFPSMPDRALERVAEALEEIHAGAGAEPLPTASG